MGMGMGMVEAIYMHPIYLIYRTKQTSRQRVGGGFAVMHLGESNRINRVDRRDVNLLNNSFERLQNGSPND